MGMEKARFEIVNNNNTIDSFDVCFNPEEYSITTTAEISGKKGINLKSNDSYQNVGEASRVFSTKLVFDTYDSGKSVRDYVKKFEQLMDRNRRLDEPMPRCKFIWGDRVFGGALTSLSQKYTLFSDDGTPLRAYLDIKIEQTPETENVNPTFDIIIDGVNINTKDVMAESISVDTSINKADSFEFRVSNAYDYDENCFKWVDDFFKTGKKIEIKMGFNNINGKVFEGFITHVSFLYKEKGDAMVEVSGLDASTILMKGLVTKTWEKMTCSGIVEEIAKGCKLETAVDSMSEKFEKLEQNRMTHYDFISLLANNNNFEFFIKFNKLYFRKLHSNKNSQVELDMSKDSISLEINHDIGDQVDTVVVLGWNYKEKKEVSGTANPIVKIGNGKDGASFTREMTGKKTIQYYYTAETSDKNAKQKADSILNHIAMKLVTGRGTWNGNSEIIAGKYMNLRGAGPNLDKLYYILSAKHSITDNGYTTTFEFGGNDMSLAELHDIKGKRDSYSLIKCFYGLTAGIVVDNNDPEKLGRVKLKLPLKEKVDQKDNETEWARVLSFMAGKEMGAFFLPEVNDEVLVAFFEGDTNHPIVLGALWNGVDTPPLTNEDGKNNIRKIKSRNGNELILNDEDGKESIEIKTKAGQVFKMEDPDNGKITVKDKSEKNLIEIDGGGSQITLKANKKINIEAGSSKILLDGEQGSITLKGSASLNIEFKSIKIEGTSVEVSASGPLTLKGAVTKIN